MKHTSTIILTCLLLVLGSACNSATPKAKATTKAVTTSASKAATKPSAVKHYGFRVVAEMPHSTDSYTQGLEWHEGVFYEGTGLNGHSRLMIVNPATGEATKSVSLSRRHFGEGITILGEKIYQLTWTSGKLFLYDKSTLRSLGELSYSGEGWGLTNDGQRLYMSDGTNRITVRNPKDFAIERTIEVKMGGRSVRYLNELEWIEGEIWANIYITDTIVRINPDTGEVVGVVDLTDLQSPTDRTFNTDVLNGIAWDASTKRLFVTGKNWNKIYQIELTENGD